MTEFYVSYHFSTGYLVYKPNHSTFKARHENMNFRNPGAKIGFVDHQHQSQLKVAIL